MFFRQAWRENDIVVQGHDHVSGNLLALQYEHAQNFKQPPVALAQILTNGSNNASTHMRPKGNLSYLLDKFVLVLRGMKMKL